MLLAKRIGKFVLKKLGGSMSKIRKIKGWSEKRIQKRRKTDPFQRVLRNNRRFSSALSS